MNLQWEGLVHGPPIKQIDPTARNAAQFDSLSLSLSREQVSSPRNQTTSGWNLVPSAYQAAARSILERNSQTVSFLQGRNVFYTRARVCRSFRRQRGRDTEGVRGIVREHFAARHYRSFCRWLNPEQVTQKLFDVNSGRWYSEDLEQFHPSARRIVPSPPPLLSDVARAQTLLADGIVRFLPRERRVTIRRAKSSALEWKRGQILPSVSFY